MARRRASTRSGGRSPLARGWSGTGRGHLLEPGLHAWSHTDVGQERGHRRSVAGPTGALIARLVASQATESAGFRDAVGQPSWGSELGEPRRGDPAAVRSRRWSGPPPGPGSRAGRPCPPRGRRPCRGRRGRRPARCRSAWWTSRPAPSPRWPRRPT